MHLYAQGVSDVIQLYEEVLITILLQQDPADPGQIPSDDLYFIALAITGRIHLDLQILPDYSLQQVDLVLGNGNQILGKLDEVDHIERFQDAHVVFLRDAGKNVTTDQGQLYASLPTGILPGKVLQWKKSVNTLLLQPLVDELFSLEASINGKPTFLPFVKLIGILGAIHFVLFCPWDRL